METLGSNADSAKRVLRCSTTKVDRLLQYIERILLTLSNIKKMVGEVLCYCAFARRYLIHYAS
jgi:hypothetical protein